MITIEIKSIFGNILFTYTKENATIKDAVEQAVKEKISLAYANLESADLRSADLRSANLRSANLESADLYSANLESANLRSADLESAENIDLAYLPIFCRWGHSIKGNEIQIGCKIKTIQEWECFFESDEVYSTQRNTKEFKQIQAVFEAYKGYLNFLNK